MPFLRSAARRDALKAFLKGPESVKGAGGEGGEDSEYIDINMGELALHAVLETEEGQSRCQPDSGTVVHEVMTAKGKGVGEWFRWSICAHLQAEVGGSVCISTVLQITFFPPNQREAPQDNVPLVLVRNLGFLKHKGRYMDASKEQKRYVMTSTS